MNLLAWGCFDGFCLRCSGFFGESICWHNFCFAEDVRGERDILLNRSSRSTLGDFTPSIGRARDYFINSILLAALLVVDVQDEHTLLERNSSACPAIPKSSNTSANFRRKTPSRFGLTNKFSVEMYDVLPKFPKRIAKEHPHILQKSEGTLDLAFCLFLLEFKFINKHFTTQFYWSELIERSRGGVVNYKAMTRGGV